MMSASIYRALDKARREVRVLKIISIEPLSCAFEYASLDDPKLVPYDAISWCWGTSGDRERIEVDGGTISIPVNALIVLSELCIPHKKWRVWIDAVCINQNDIAERSHQVSIMSAIYATARKTLVWLGRDDGTTERAIRSLQATDAWRRVRHQKGDHEGCGLWCERKVADPLPRDIEWEPILSFFASGWFHRLWVIQEVALSRHADVYRGKFHVCWSFLAVVAHYLYINYIHNHNVIPAGIAGIANAQTIARVDAVGLPQLFALSSRNFEATDPRDRAFALYGLFSNHSEEAAVRLAMTPDYTRSLARVYTDITKATVMRGGNYFGLLLEANRFVTRLDAVKIESDVPSWVPRFDYVTSVMRGSYKRVVTCGSACGKLEARFKDAPSDELCVAGIIIDEIEEICGTVPSKGLDGDADDPVTMTALFKTLTSFWEAARRHNSRTPEHELSSMLRTTLIAGSDYTCGIAEIYTHFERDFQAFVSTYWPEPARPPFELKTGTTSAHESDDDEFGDIEEDEWDVHESDDELEDDDDDFEANWSQSDEEEERTDDLDDTTTHAKRFRHDIYENACNRPYFVAKSSRLGCAARGALTGDVIAIIYGLEVPVIVRPAGDGRYTFVGDAYLTGIMSGEYITELRRDGALAEATQWFNLI